MQHLWVRLQGWIDETNRRLASCKAQLVGARKDARKDGRRGRRAMEERESAHERSDDIVSNSRHVGEAAPGEIVDAGRVAGVDCHGIIGSRVVWVRRVLSGKVGGHGILLVGPMDVLVRGHEEEHSRTATYGMV